MSKRKKYSTEEKIDYYEKRLFDGSLEITKRIYAANRLNQLRSNSSSPGEVIYEKIPVSKHPDANKLTWAQNYVLTKGNKSGSHVVFVIDKNNDSYSVVGLSSKNKTDGKKNLPIDNIELPMDGFSYVVTNLRINKIKTGKINDNDFLHNKNLTRPLRVLSQKEIQLIINTLNLDIGNRDNFTYWKNKNNK